jgi:hypothetical protein
MFGNIVSNGLSFTAAVSFSHGNRQQQQKQMVFRGKSKKKINFRVRLIGQKIAHGVVTQYFVLVFT